MNAVPWSRALSALAGLTLWTSIGACGHTDRTDGTGEGAGARRSIRARVPVATDVNARLVHGGSGTARVTYQPRVRIVERDAALASLTAMSTDGATLLFEGAGPQLRALVAGDVLVIRGLLARKVIGVDVNGSSVAALTTTASISDVIKDGHIEVTAPLRFTPEPSVHADTWRQSPWDRLLAMVATTPIEAQEAQRPRGTKARDVPYAREGTRNLPSEVTYEGWKTRFTAVPGLRRLDLTLQMAKDTGGFKGLIAGEGHISDFDFSSSIDIESGVVKRLEAAYRRFNGAMSLSYEISKNSPGVYDDKSRIKLPGSITIPLYQFLDGIPLFLEVSAAVIVQPAIQGGKQYSHGAFNAAFNGTQGFLAKGTAIDADGKLQGVIEFVEDRHISAIAPVGMALNFAMPRVELTLNPFKALGEIQSGLLQKSPLKNMERAGKAADIVSGMIAKRVFGEDVAKKLGAIKPADALKSDALAYIQLLTSTAVANTGFSVMTPCTHTDLTMAVWGGASAQALGREVGHVSKKFFERKLTRIDPPGTRLCEY